MRKNYIYLDLGFFEDCNLKCTYCRNKLILNSCNYSFCDLEEEVNLFQQYFSAGVVKVSGYGEITLWKDFEKALFFLAEKFPSVQIITNGTFSDEIMQILCAPPNVTINFTIDGHEPSMNSYRTGNSLGIHRRIMRNLDTAVRCGKRIEINSVLHDRNIEMYDKFIEFIYHVYCSDHIMIFPFPVKVFDRTKDNQGRLNGDLSKLGIKLIHEWELYQKILPPLAYFQDLYDFSINGRTETCYVNWANIGTGSKDERLICPNYGETLSLGDFRTSFENITLCQKIEQENLLRQIGTDCCMCFNHYHILNLFLQGKISLSDLRKVPSLDYPDTLKVVQKVKEEFLDTLGGK